MAHDVNQSEKDIAAQVRSALVNQISADRYELWIAPETRWHWTSGVLTVTFQTEFACQLARRMVGKDIASALRQVAGANAELQLKVGSVDAVQTDLPSAQPLPLPQELPLQADESESQPQRTAMAADSVGRDADRDEATEPRILSLNREPVSSAAPVTSGSTTNPGVDGARPTPNANPSVSGRESWGRFIAGDCNQLAWTTASMVVSQPGRMTPVLLHGPCGVGKSHLLGAIAQQLRTHCRLRRVAHMTCEQFTNDFTEAIKGGGLPLFRRKYRDVDALLIDDVHFLVGKKATIGELKSTLDNLLRLGKQVIFTSDRAVNDLHLLGHEIVGRLRGGLVSPLMPIDEKTRTSLLHREIADSNIELDKEIVQQIAARTVGDGRVLQGIVKRLVAMATLTGQKLSWDQCWNSVYDLVQATQPVVRLGDIERVVCEVFGLEPTSLQSPSKARTVAQPRMLAMFLARKYTPAAYKEIGDYFGKRRHSTVISAEKTVEEWLRDNASLGDARGLSIRDALRHVESNLQVG